MKSKVFAIALCVALPAGATPPTDPWALVPALPSGCYEEQDGYLAKVDTAIAMFDQEIDAQRAINDEIGGQVASAASADPYAMMDRMQDYLMNNPEEATKMMEDLYATGQTIGDELVEDIEREQELTAPLDGLSARYRTAYAEHRAPIEAMVAALPTEEGEAGAYFTDEAIAQLPAINRQANAAYERLCAQWWQNGPFVAPLTEFRAFLANDRAPRQDKVFAQGKQQWDIQGIDTSEARSLAAMEAARDYLKQVQRVYGLRVQNRTDLHIRP